jgi:hypothetical protein
MKKTPPVDVSCSAILFCLQSHACKLHSYPKNSKYGGLSNRHTLCCRSCTSALLPDAKVQPWSEHLPGTFTPVRATHRDVRCMKTNVEYLWTSTKYQRFLVLFLYTSRSPILTIDLATLGQACTHHDSSFATPHKLLSITHQGQTIINLSSLHHQVSKVTQVTCRPIHTKEPR